MIEKLILGIDPGTNIMGYGLIQHKDNKIEVVDFGIVKLRRNSNMYIRLGLIYENVIDLIEKLCPDEMGIESPFYAKNVQSMLKLGRAQGVAIAAAISRQIPVYEYSPRTIKQTITGNGNATKEAVARVLELNLKIDINQKIFDATDALAVAICHVMNQTQLKFSKAKPQTWAEFIKSHPDRLCFR